ncbi:hypothetical protein EV191_1011146 [Tamaricihabitans halophyticus]|uniref:Uncharacterized protein n=1 Tax=Tamaricihabitans halophyticus TaxID=1262583 RepID=A0A4R2R3P7_9PSEU|nr:hypothetical protein [Tamaricihabitans halophyticus]TCP57193.1 hypothetical protein EV191_1011146 [Tamaricihabitans halophyticus]
MWLQVSIVAVLAVFFVARLIIVLGDRPTIREPQRQNDPSLVRPPRVDSPPHQ